MGCRHLLLLGRVHVGLGDTLELVLLLDVVAVGTALGGVDRLVGQALGARLVSVGNILFLVTLYLSQNSR